MTPYTELELINLIAAFEETLTELVTPALIEEKKRDIIELKAMQKEQTNVTSSHQ